MFDRAKFEVQLNIEKVTRVPYATGKIYVKWNVTDSPRPDAHGRTESTNIGRTEAAMNYDTTFHQRIGLRTPSRMLRTCQIKFDVIWEPVSGRGVPIGSLNLDLSQFVTPPHASAENKADGMAQEILGEQPRVAGRVLSFMLSGARTNCLLVLRIHLKYMHGDSNYEIPEFNGPALNVGVHDMDNTNAEQGAYRSSTKKNREKLRKLRDDALEDLRRGHAPKQSEESWTNLDNLLLRRDVPAVPREMPPEFAEYKIADPRADISEHQPGTPYVETEIRENFATWKLLA